MRPAWIRTVATKTASRSAAGLVAAISLWPSAGQAQVLTGDLEVRLNISASCDISGSTGGTLGGALLDFGTATLLQSAIDADTGTGAQALEVLCNPGVNYTLTFDAGQNGGGNIANRAMQRDGGSELVRYQIHQDAARNIMLDTGTGTGTGSVQTTPIYGRTEPPSPPAVGTYQDFIVVTLSF